MKLEVCLLKDQDASGSAVYSLTDGTMEVQLATLGATIRSIKIPDAYGNLEEVTLGYAKDEDWKVTPVFFGVSVGRYANRIAGASFSVDGKNYSLENNENGNCLHSGATGFHNQYWKAETFSTPEEAGVIFSRLSPDGEGGFPGNLEAVIKYTLTSRRVLKVNYEAKTDKDTIINLTNHAYFNLGGPKVDTVLDHVMWTSASQWLPVNDKLIPTGEIAQAAGTAFDFRVPKPIGRDIDKIGSGYDHCYVLDVQNKAAPTIREAVRVQHPASGRTLRFYTDQPGFQFYTGNWVGGILGRDSKPYAKHGGFCLESQKFPDSTSHKEWKDNVILKAGETYRHEFHYAFEF